MSSIYILWDASYIWGLLAWRTAQSLSLPYRLVRGEEIAQGLLSGKPPALLLVPGGNARMKSVALGDAGMQAIRDYVEQGGAYLGFCGGAGLGLSGSEGLGLCPWGRAKFTDRMQHFVSGHIQANVQASHDLVPQSIGKEPPVPIWWPGRFAPEETGDVEVLATYTTPCDDFWVADLPLDTLPPGTFSEWESLYDIRLRPTFLEAQPCILSGRYGKGRYVLSYTHLETPDSPVANQWLLHIIKSLSGVEAPKSNVPSWDLENQPAVWQDGDLIRARAIFDDIVTIGRNHCLFFKRNSWLIGWRSGIPGANLNNLYSAIVTAVSTHPTVESKAYWQNHHSEFMRKLELFHEGVKGYLLAERLAMTLSKTFPETVSRESLRNQRAALFGPPMDSGGLYQELLDTLDELLYLQLPHGDRR
ncbi:BPL-N domain-containing protein [Oleidesulfovibrio sp.]|uniref:BPL-N domain-containing protein n=1 Tax=Oleidesulfovibrio sp. TaxID=2909707 RepID=UPI003A83E686